MSQENTRRILEHAAEYAKLAAEWCAAIDRERPNLGYLDRHELLIVLHNCERSLGWMAREIERLERLVSADLDLSLFNRKREHGCLDIECRSCAERTDDPVLERVREIFGDR